MNVHIIIIFNFLVFVDLSESNVFKNPSKGGEELDNFDSGFFTRNNDLLIINHRKRHSEYFNEINFFKYKSNNNDNLNGNFNYEETHHYFSHTSPKFFVYPHGLLTTYNGALISEWNDQHFCYQN